MCADKADIHSFGCEQDHYDQSVVITLNLKDISLIANAINAVERLFDIGKAGPFCLFCLVIPILKGGFRSRVL